MIYIPEHGDHGVVDALKHVAFTVDNVTINFNLQKALSISNVVKSLSPSVVGVSHSQMRQQRSGNCASFGATQIAVSTGGGKFS